MRRRTVFVDVEDKLWTSRTVVDMNHLGESIAPTLRSNTLASNSHRPIGQFLLRTSALDRFFLPVYSFQFTKKNKNSVELEHYIYIQWGLLSACFHVVCDVNRTGQDSRRDTPSVYSI